MKKKLRELLAWDYSDIKDDIMYKSEVQANKIVAIAMINCGLVFLIMCLLAMLNVLPIPTEKLQRFNTSCINAFAFLTVPAILCFCFKGRKKWLKYLLLIEFVIVTVILDSLFTYNAVLFMVIPVVLSCRYYSQKFTLFLGVLTIILFFFSALKWNDNQIMYEYNVFNFKEIAERVVNGEFVYDSKEYTKRVMLYSFVPRALIYSCITFICVSSSSRGKMMINEQADVASKNSRIESELSLATNIQASMLPSIFPAYPDRGEFDIYATMNPAKEVGGDFYDFFMLDEKTIGLVMADVSGKGVPAALFMVIAKTLIKNQAQSGLTPGEVFTKVNQMLCEGNELGLFVTAWLGYFNIETGVITYSNAGHNPPLIKHGNDDFEYLKSKHGFVLAGMEALKYKNYTVDMSPGDKIFLYTDGVTEAVNENNEQFGEERLKDTLNSYIFNNQTHESPKGFVEHLRGELVKFANKAEQFDDITMLAFAYKQRYENNANEREFKAVDEELPLINEFIEGELEKYECSMKFVNQVEIAVEEVFVNIAHYAYTNTVGKMRLAIEKDDEDIITIRFMDYGMPFNPLLKKDPDITLEASERQIGGLGIFMVKKIMDSVEYKYENGHNILICKKKK